MARPGLVALLLTYSWGTFFAQHFNSKAPAGISINHDGPDVEPFDILSIGTGAAWIDANADGNLDLYITMRTGNNLLYIGDGKGGFTESAVAYNVHDPTGDGSGVAVADYNNDGYQDLFLANSLSDRLFKNEGGTGFTDVTAMAGFDLSDDSRGTSASWADFDNDGYIDLYVTNHSPMSEATNASTNDQLYRNNGDGTFTDVSDLLSAAGAIHGTAFIGGWMDYDLDGDQDLFVINDCFSNNPNPVPNKVFRNDGDTDSVLLWNFTEVSAVLGVDSCINGMGIAMADFNRDGYEDYYCSNIGPALLFERDTAGGFNEVADAMGVDDQPWPLFSWGTCFFDADLDGWKDLFLILGSHHYPSTADPHDNQFFLNDGGTGFTDYSVNFALDDSTRGRTVISGDYDNDGDIDLVLVNYGEEIIIKENDLVHDNHYLKITLEGTVSNRNAIGARVKIRMPDGEYQWAVVHSGSSLGGGDALALHFGLGGHARVDSLFVEWPAGSTQVLTNIPADRTLHIKEVSGSTAINYIEVAQSLGINTSCGTCGVGNGVSFADFDGDGLDDLSFGTETGQHPRFYRNTGSGFQDLTGLVSCNDKNEQILWFDMDNDGDRDLLVTNFSTDPAMGGQNRLYENTGDLNMVEITDSCGFLMQHDPSYGAVAGDYDKDGDLDLYIANWSFADTYANTLYRNEGNGTFTDVTTMAGVADGFRLTFCSGFFDYNNDGWPDLYNSQDRYTDPNSLFENNGDGTFTDVSAASNSNTAIDAMNVGIGDYDNDDDMDIYITNTTLGNELLQNQGDETFTEVAGDVGVAMYKVTWGGHFVDMDLDLDLDLYVSAMHMGQSTSSDVFVNQFPLDTFHTIEPAGMDGDTLNSFSNAIGDINHDGKPDIAVNNGDVSAVVNPFHVWQNVSTTANRWLKIKLHGVESNIDGVGSKIEYFVGGSKYIRYTQCGSGYLAQNSFTEQIGTGTSYAIDSLIVYWPSGFVSKLYDVITGRQVDIYESDVLYVDKDATGSGHGTSWEHAFTDLQNALAFADSSYIREIWISEGIYTPDTANDRSRSFVIPDGVQLYGGFSGVETDRSQRNAEVHQVTLSADIGAQGDSLDNSYHLVRIPKSTQQALLDGVLISGAMATGIDSADQHGAGVICEGSAELVDIEITNCHAMSTGAAIYASGWRGLVTIKDINLYSNTSPGASIVSDGLAQIEIDGNNEIRE